MDVQDPGPGDEELVRRARTGDGEALERLILRHFDAAFRLASGLLRDDDRAADVAQETVLKAIRGLGSYRGDASFRSWLLSIARNEAIEALRRGDREPVATPEMLERQSAETVDPLTNVEDGRRTRRLRAAVERLPEKQRLAVSLRVYEGLSYREIAGITGSSEGACRVNYHHGIRRLKEWLGHE